MKWIVEKMRKFGMVAFLVCILLGIFIEPVMLRVMLSLYSEVYRPTYFLVVNGTEKKVVACSMQPAEIYRVVVDGGMVVYYSRSRGCVVVPQGMIVGGKVYEVNVTGVRILGWR